MQFMSLVSYLDMERALPPGRFTNAHLFHVSLSSFESSFLRRVSGLYLFPAVFNISLVFCINFSFVLSVIWLPFLQQIQPHKNNPYFDFVFFYVRELGSRFLFLLFSFLLSILQSDLVLKCNKHAPLKPIGLLPSRIFHQFFFMCNMIRMKVSKNIIQLNQRYSKAFWLVFHNFLIVG